MKKSLLILFAAAAALLACSKPEKFNAPSSQAVKFAVENINTYTVKADLDPIGDGKTVGICAGAPIAAYNVAGTISGTAITATINWTAEQVANDTPSDFWAIYPNITLGGDDKTMVKDYEIKSAEAVQYAGEVLCAKATGKPSDANVKLSFKHPFAKVVFKVTNNIEDDTVKDITVTGFARKGDLDAKDGTVTNLSDDTTEAIVVVNKGTAAKVTTFETIVLPQSVAPVITVVMNSGRTYTFTLAAAFDFKAGKVATAEMTVDGSTHGGVSPSSAPVVLAFETVEWTDDTAAMGSFGAPVGAGETGWWYVNGTISGESWTEFIPLAASGVNTWTVTIAYTPDVEANEDSKGIKIVYINGDTYQWYGSATVPTYGTEPFLFEDLSAADGTPNIKLGETGSYKLSFYSDNHHMHVEKAE